MGEPDGLPSMGSHRVERKRASPRGEAGTPGFLSVSDSDRRVPAELGQESQCNYFCCSFQFSRSDVSDSMRPHESH